jgi:hypothetical protein
MSLNTLAEYRNLYRDRHGVQCPLSDEEVREAIASAGTTEETWPLDLAVVDEMEALLSPKKKSKGKKKASKAVIVDDSPDAEEGNLDVV